jgi:hypothetical protein
VSLHSLERSQTLHGGNHGENYEQRVSSPGSCAVARRRRLWVSAPLALMLASRWEDRVILWLALSGAAILANRLTEEEPEGARFYEEAIQEEKSICPVAEMEEEY